MFCAVYSMIAFTRLGVSFGLACIINATVPVTIGAAMLVPVRLRYGFLGVRNEPLSSIVGLSRYSTLPGAASEAMPTPVATTSGLAAKSLAVGPRELNVPIVSSARVSVPLWL